MAELCLSCRMSRLGLRNDFAFIAFFTSVSLQSPPQILVDMLVKSVRTQAIIQPAITDDNC